MGRWVNRIAIWSAVAFGLLLLGVIVWEILPRKAKPEIVSCLVVLVPPVDANIVVHVCGLEETLPVAFETDAGIDYIDGLPSNIGEVHVWFTSDSARGLVGTVVWEAIPIEEPGRFARYKVLMYIYISEREQTPPRMPWNKEFGLRVLNAARIFRIRSGNAEALDSRPVLEQLGKAQFHTLDLEFEKDPNWATVSHQVR